MAKMRSPGYPAIGLREAVDKVRMIYDQDYQNPIARMVAAQHMGYQGLNGKSLGILAALQKYGLLEGRGGNTRVSDLAVQVLAHPPGSSERISALTKAASEPNLFSELDARFPDGRASEQAIRSYLLTMRFIPSAADSTIRSYRETKDLLLEERGGQQVPLNHTITPGTGTLAVSASPPQVSSGPYSSTSYSFPSVGQFPPSGISVSTEIANIRVSKDCAIRLLADGPYSKRSIEALVKNLELQLSLGTYDEVDPAPSGLPATSGGKE
jgi:hypothetical protein